MVVQALVGIRIVQWTAGLYVGSRFYVIEQFEELGLYTFPSAVNGGFYAWMAVLYVSGQGEQGAGIFALAEEQEASDSEVAGDQGVDDFRSEFVANVFFEERGVAPRAITPAV